MFTVYLLIGLSLSIRDKKGEKQMKFGKNFNYVLTIFIQGEMKLFLKAGENKKVLMYLTQEESQFACLLFAVVAICQLLFIYLYSTHALMCSFECFRKGRYILIQIFYLFQQLLGQKYQIGICDVFEHFIVIGLFFYLSISFCM